MDEFLRPGKNQVTSDQIAPGAIGLEHLGPGLFSELRQISLHNHSGVKSRKVQIQDLDGYFSRSGFLMYSSDGTKRYRVTVDSGTGAFVLTEV